MEDFMSENLFSLYAPSTSFFNESTRNTLMGLCHNIDEMVSIQNYLDPWYLTEKVHDYNKLFSKKTGGVRKAGDDLAGLYDTATDVEAKAINTGWNIISRLGQLMLKAINKILTLASKIPNAIVSAMEFVSQIPSNIRSKIKGDIQLYVSMEDLNTVYRENILNRIDTILANASKLAKGNSWKMIFHGNVVGKALVNKLLHLPGSKDDKDYAKTIKTISAQLTNIKFAKSIIKISNPNIRDIYFGDGVTAQGDTIQIQGAKRKEQNMTYLQALKYFMDEINKRKSSLEEIVDALNLKYDKSISNDTWAELPVDYQSMITDSFKGISTTITCIANFVKYISADIKTYHDAISKVFKMSTKTKNKSDKVKTESYFDVNDDNYFEKYFEEYNSIMECYNSLLGSYDSDDILYTEGVKEFKDKALKTIGDLWNKFINFLRRILGKLSEQEKMQYEIIKYLKKHPLSYDDVRKYNDEFSNKLKTFNEEFNITYISIRDLDFPILKLFTPDAADKVINDNKLIWYEILFTSLPITVNTIYDSINNENRYVIDINKISNVNIETTQTVAEFVNKVRSTYVDTININLNTESLEKCYNIANSIKWFKEVKSLIKKNNQTFQDISHDSLELANNINKIFRVVLDTTSLYMNLLSFKNNYIKILYYDCMDKKSSTKSKTPENTKNTITDEDIQAIELIKTIAEMNETIKERSKIKK